jgi:hypothetical protein
MNTHITSPSLKKPFGVFVLAILFILAPWGNIFISFLGSGISNWYEPDVFMALLKTVTSFDWIWLGLLTLTGVLLLRPHKLSWSVAIFTLVLVLGINALRLFQADGNSIEPHFLKVFAVMAGLVTLGVLVIAFYFRFPYIDRRTQWTSNKHNADRRDQKREAQSTRRKL